MKESGVAFFLIVIGLGVIMFGGLVRIGWYKRWYLMDDDTIFFDKSAHYALVPAGLSLISLGIMLFAPPMSQISRYALYIFFCLIGLAVTFFFWQPSWLKPGWIRWLEKKHGDALGVLIQEARETPDWGQRVSTKTQLEHWVAEVRLKHSLPTSTTSVLQKQDRSWLRRKWPVGLVIVAVSSGLGQYLLGNGLIGFVGGWVILGLIYLLRPKE